MLKSKLMFGLVALAMLLTLAPSGFAQVNITVNSNPSPTESNNNITAETNNPSTGGDLLIVGTALSDAPVTAGSIRFTYPAEITSSTTFPTGDPVRITSATGFWSSVTASSNIDIDFADGELTISLPDVVPSGSGATGTISVAGVRINVSELTDTEDLTAEVELTGTNINLNLQTTEVVVIEETDDAIDQIQIGKIADTTSTSFPSNTGTATIFTNRQTPDETASFTIREGHNWAWFANNAGQFTGAPATWPNDAGIALQFQGVPAGVTLTLEVIASWNTGASGGDVDSTYASLSDSTITNEDDETLIQWGTVNLPTSGTSAINRVQVRITDVSVSSTASLSAGSIQVRARMNPIGEVLDEDDEPLTSEFPRFAEDWTSFITIVNIVPANTTLLMPYAVREVGFDTGIALANTSADPFGGSTAGGATAQTGTVTLNFFPRTATGAGTSFSLTTSATVRPGQGLDSNGRLPAGSTWTVLLSELLTAAGQTGSFSGYIFFTTNFQYAHGAPFISNFTNFTSFAPMLVVPPPALEPRDAEAESLGF